MTDTMTKMGTRAHRDAGRAMGQAGRRLASAKRRAAARDLAAAEQVAAVELPPWLAGDTSGLPMRPPGRRA